MQKMTVLLGMLALSVPTKAQLIGASAVDLEFSGLDKPDAYIKAEGLSSGKPVGSISLKNVGENQVSMDYDLGASGATKATILFMNKEQVIRTIQDGSGPARGDIEIYEVSRIINATVAPVEEWWPVVLAAVIYCSRVEFHSHSSYGQVFWSIDVGIGCGGSGIQPITVDFNGDLIHDVTSIAIVPKDGNMSSLQNVDKILVSSGGGARVISAN